jgi:hypothetical protein
VLEPGDDPDDAEPVIYTGDIDPAEAAALTAASLARALPRDPLHLARAGVALRALAREATVYPETLRDMASGIAVTARDPEDVRLFSGTDAEPDDDGRDWRMPDARATGIALGAAIVVAAIGVGIAAALVAVLDPAAANRTTALVVGGLIGAAVGAAVALRMMRR